MQIIKKQQQQQTVLPGKSIRNQYNYHRKNSDELRLKSCDCIKTGQGSQQWVKLMKLKRPITQKSNYLEMKGQNWKM
jgi:hypothetical protein